jgi:hypothetical protein
MKRIFVGRKFFNWKLIYINFFILVTGVIFLELFFGDWLKDNNLNQLMLIRNSDWVFRIVDDHPYPYDKKYIHYSRDQWGLRGESFRNPSDVKMLTVGGSTTDQRYITEGETWQDVMARTLMSHGIDFPVANAGIDGHSTFGHILALKTWLSQIEGLEPEFIGFYVGINDLLRQEGNEYDMNLGYYYDDGLHFIRKIMQKSALYHAFRIINGALIVKSKKAGHSKVDFSSLDWETETWSRRKIEEYSGEHREALDQYASRLDLLCTLTRTFGSTPVYITQANSRGFDRGKQFEYSRTLGNESAYALRAVNNVTMNACRSCSRAICIDMARELRFVSSDYYDTAHNTPAGAMKIGRYLGNKMVETVGSTQ